MRALSSENLDSFRKDVAGLGQEQGGHGFLVGKRGVEVVEHLLRIVRMIVFILFGDDGGDDDYVHLVDRKDFSFYIVW